MLQKDAYKKFQFGFVHRDNIGFGLIDWREPMSTRELYCLIKGMKILHTLKEKNNANKTLITKFKKNSKYDNLDRNQMADELEKIKKM